ncbi:hypothetical protein ABK040_002348 [Willaertia magna]
MSELFRNYEEEYFELSNGIKRQLADVKNQTGDSKQKTLRKIERDLESANKNIKQMNLEMQSTVDIKGKEQLKNKLKTYKQDVSNLQKQLEMARIQSKGSAARDQLLGTEGDEELQFASSEDHRNRLIQSTKVLERSNDTLNRASQILDETEQIGIDSAIKLREQGDQIRGTRDKLYDVDTEIKQGGRILGRMSRREILNKIIIVGVILFLLVIIGVILFFIIYNALPKSSN